MWFFLLKNDQHLGCEMGGTTMEGKHPYGGLNVGETLKVGNRLAVSSGCVSRCEGIVFF